MDNYMDRPIETETRICETCGGNGEFVVDKDEFEAYLYNRYYPDPEGNEDAQFEREEWNRTGRIFCTICNGMGKISKRGY